MAYVPLRCSHVSTGQDDASTQHMVPSTVWMCYSFLTLADLTPMCLVCANEDQVLVHGSIPTAASSTSRHQIFIQEMDARTREFEAACRASYTWVSVFLFPSCVNILILLLHHLNRYNLRVILEYSVLA